MDCKFRNMKRLLLLILFSQFISEKAESQDFIFSQYFASQPYLNPSMTGFFDGSYRIVGHYRMQWAPVESGISTYGVSGDIKLGENHQSGDYVGLGIGLYRDDVYGLIANNTARLNASYTKSFGYNTKSYLSLGTNLGMDFRQVNTSQFVTSNGDAESPQNENKFVPNLGLGINYQVVFPEAVNFFIGGAVDHIVSDNISIFNNEQQNAKRITAYTSARLKSAKTIYLLPAFLLSMQEAHRQINFGVSTQLLMREYHNNKSNIQIGLYTRLGNESLDAIIGMLRYEINGLQLGLSYDHNVNELNSVTNGFGALEMSVGYIGLINKVIKSRTECPDLKSF